jgi:hypothetical protein
VREDYGNVKLKIGKWTIIGRSATSLSATGIEIHDLWHQCESGPDLWEVYPTTWSWWRLNLRSLPLRWRCSVCHKIANPGIVAAFKMLHTEYCVEQEARALLPRCYPGG